MLSTENIAIPVKRERLLFIDMARSIAILLMLEGHFIEHSFNGFDSMVATVKATGSSGNLFFDWWYFMKGFTAPMFFTVTGIVFVYLLSMNNESGFFKNRRVRKGFRRSFELLFWGFALQFNLSHFKDYFTGKFGDWIYAFHVLQCIGVGISFLLLIYGLWKLLKFGPLYMYYFIFATTIFTFYPFFKGLPDGVYYPQNMPLIVQNVFKGPHSVFPVIPWLAFSIYGGMIGAMLFKFQKNVRKFWFPLTFLFIGIVLNIFGYVMFKSVDHIMNQLNIHNDLGFVNNAWLYGRLGQVLIALALLMYVEKFFRIKDSLFLQIGQNTLPIYVLHVMLLYNGMLGIGLSDVLKDSLSGWQAILGAAGFITIFVLFIYFFEPIIGAWTKVKAVFWQNVGKVFNRGKEKEI